MVEVVAEVFVVEVVGEEFGVAEDAACGVAGGCVAID